jgi:hypothetical protein
MPLTRRRTIILAQLTLVATAGGLGLAHGVSRATPPGELPATLADSTIRRLVNEMSEPGGVFRSDNFVSNEITFQYVIPELLKTTPAGGVYLGVGPDQNFTYLVAHRPKVAFIVDIRRQNMIQHLMYKALIETSADRAEFISRLFSLPRPAGLDSSATAQHLFETFASVVPDSAMFRKTFADIREHLVGRHRFGLGAEDLTNLEYVFTAFYAAGPDLTYNFNTGQPGTGFYGRGRMPTYAELMVENDGAGLNRGYLGSEENFRALKALETNNLIVPLVGDFAGDKALRAVGRYVRDHGATVSAFYLSNVEQYLFRQDDDWRKFFNNVATFPIDTRSTFVRAVFNFGGYGYFNAPSSGTPGPRSQTMLAPIGESLAAFNSGRIQSYYDVVQMSR